MFICMSYTNYRTQGNRLQSTVVWHSQSLPSPPPSFTQNIYRPVSIRHYNPHVLQPVRTAPTLHTLNNLIPHFYFFLVNLFTFIQDSHCCEQLKLQYFVRNSDAKTLTKLWMVHQLDSQHLIWGSTRILMAYKTIENILLYLYCRML